MKIQTILSAAVLTAREICRAIVHPFDCRAACPQSFGCRDACCGGCIFGGSRAPARLASTEGL